MKKIISVLLALVIMTCAVMPAFAAENGLGEYRIVVNSTLNVRSAPSTDAGKIGVLKSGAIVNVTEIKNTGAVSNSVWGKITLNGETGWISLDYAIKYDPSNPSGSVDVLAKLDELRKKFPDGKYWNWMGKDKKDLDVWTNIPCPSNGRHTDTSHCNGQCDGFARKLGLDIFGYSTYDSKHWETRYDINNLCYGDLIRFGGWHTVVVTGKKGSTWYITDCNWDCKCGIDWDRAFDMDRYVKQYAGNYYVLHFIGNNYLVSGNYSTTTTTTAATTTTTTTTTTTVPPYFQVEHISLDTDFVLMNPGDTRTLSANVYGSGSVVWSSSSGSVASVDQNGKITAKRSGQATITAATGSAIASCTVSVSDTTFVRLGGESRTATANLIAGYGWNGTGARNVVLVNAFSFADALAGVPLAGALSAPILLTANDSSGLEADVAETISSLGSRNIYILGGTDVVSDSIVKSLTDSGCTVERISGANRYATASAIALRLAEVTGKKPAEVFFACAANYPDALAVSSVAAIKGSPILYAPSDSKLDSDTEACLRQLNPSVVTVLGGTSAVSDKAYDAISSASSGAVGRICGKDRFETALAICRSYDSVFEGSSIAVTTGYSFPDALAGGAFAAAKGIPVILADTRNGISSAMSSFISGRTVHTVYVFGGQNAVSDRIASDYLA